MALVYLMFVFFLLGIAFMIATPVKFFTYLALNILIFMFVATPIYIP